MRRYLRRVVRRQFVVKEELLGGGVTLLIEATEMLCEEAENERNGEWMVSPTSLCKLGYKS